MEGNMGYDDAGTTAGIVLLWIASAGLMGVSGHAALRQQYVIGDVAVLLAAMLGWAAVTITNMRHELRVAYALRVRKNAASSGRTRGSTKLNGTTKPRTGTLTAVPTTTATMKATVEKR
jgi:hypothetical protein